MDMTCAAHRVLTEFHYNEDPLPADCARTLAQCTRQRAAVLEAAAAEDPFDLRWGEARIPIAQAEGNEDPYQDWRLYMEGDTVEVWFVEDYVGRATWCALRMRLTHTCN